MQQSEPNCCKFQSRSQSVHCEEPGIVKQGKKQFEADSSDVSRSKSSRHNHVHHKSPKTHMNPSLFPRHEAFRISTNRCSSSIDEVCDTFVVDRKGDSENLRYGENARSKVPAYHVSSKKQPLGSVNQREPSRTQSPLSSLDRKGLRKLQTQEIYLNLSNRKATKSPGDVCVDAPEDFISLRSDPRNRKKLPWGREFTSDYGDEEKNNQSSNDSCDGNSDSDHVEDTAVKYNDEAKGRNAALYRSIEAEPANATNWLDYIDFQAFLLTAAQNRDNEQSHTKSISEVKLSIYEDALEKGAKPMEPLLIGMMREAKAIWSQSKFTTRWEEILFQHPDCIDLHIEYINQLQSDFVRCEHELCKEQYVKYFRLVEDMQPGVRRAEYQIHALLRFTNYLRDMGYYEYAIALWQSNLEFNLFISLKAGDGKSTEKDERSLVEFATFWDNEGPRLGEPEILGCRDKSRSASGESVNFRTNSSSEYGQEVSCWFTTEIASIAASILPGRSMDLENDDPYHVILFSDLEPFILDISSCYISHIVDGFLSFMQLPPLGYDPIISAFTPFRNDQYVNFPPQESNSSKLTVSKTEKNADTNILGLSSSLEPVEVIQNSETLFHNAKNNWTCISEGMSAGSHFPMKAKLIDGILSQLVQEYPTHKDITEYYMAWLVHSPSLNSAKDFRIKAKSIIAKQQSEIRHYNAFALGQSKLGNHKSSQDAFAASSIGVTAGQEMPQYTGRLYVWRSWLWESLRAVRLDCVKQNSNEIALLITFHEDHPSAAQGKRPNRDVAQVLEELGDILQYWVTKPNNVFASITAEIHALISYSSKDYDLEMAMASFSQSANLLQTYHGPTSPSLELLYQAQAQLIEHHMDCKKSIKPSRLLDTIAHNLKQFPTNTMLLSLHSELEQRAGIESRIRRLTQFRSQNQQLTQPIPLTTHAFNIHREMEQAACQSALGSTPHSVRAAFEKAVSDSTAQHSSAIWYAWVVYEAEISAASDTSEQAGKRLKDVFYRGWREVPWVKRFAMLPFHPSLRKYFTAQELSEVYSIMQEKGMRIHVELESETLGSTE